ncbi:hypothetical protein GYMLUDRAFT_381265 [Collybiopsis luxurians FD-317 M1]|nr:hypothetical protein GYMLUDRAFT_381265 [Collybiopsis luxurians FD-317 M1]
MLTFEHLSLIDESRNEIICNLLPSFGRLACVDLSKARVVPVDFSQFMAEYPTVSTVLVKQIATQSFGLSFFDTDRHSRDFISDLSRSSRWELIKADLSKVVLFSLLLHSSHSQEGLPPNGMKVVFLNILDPEELDQGFGSRFFSGLGELVLTLHDQPVLFSWLPTFMSAHLHLHEICLSSPKQGFHVPAYISPFFDEVDRLGLRHYLDITDLYLSQAKTDSHSVQQLHVTRVSLKARGPRLLTILLLLSSLFSSIENLSVDIEWHQHIYNLGDIIVAFFQFPCIKSYVSETFSNIWNLEMNWSMKGFQSQIGCITMIYVSTTSRRV